MTTQVIIVILCITFLVIGLYRELFRPLLTFLIVVIALFLFGIISINDVIGGLANEQLIIIMLLLILSDVIKKTNAIDAIVQRLFHQGLTYKGFMARMMFTVSNLAPWFHNTPVVAIAMPHVYTWAKKKGISPSKVMLPLSYATMLGGAMTLIGTSTNMFVNGLAIDNTYCKNFKVLADFKALHPSGVPIFSFTPIGFPLAIIGILYLLYIGTKLLPSRKDALADFNEKTREYMVETQVPIGSSLIGKSIEQANLRNLRGLFLVEIVRGDESLGPVSPEEVIEQDDILIFAGETDTILDLMKNPKDLILPKFSDMPKREFMEVKELVLSNRSSLAGLKIREANFRGKYDAAIIAVNRDGERLTGKIGEVELRPGDLLLILAGSDFKGIADNSNDFYFISDGKEIKRYNKLKVAILIGGIILSFMLSAFEVMPGILLIGLVLVLCLCVPLKIVKFNEIQRSADLELFLILAMSLAIGKAIHNSKADELFAGWLIGGFEGFHSNIAILFGIYLMTNILAMFATNKTAVAITFPIAIATMMKLGLTDPTPFILCVALAGCAEFMTPFGYQTNLMVYGPGGYKFIDYIKVGFGLTILYMVGVVALISWIYHL
ncbi:MAG: SLC13 family permease [Bacteroidota bacterium]